MDRCEQCGAVMARMDLHYQQCHPGVNRSPTVEPPPVGMKWARTEYGRTLVPATSSRSKPTPHAALKKAMRDKLRDWRRAHNLPAVLLPSIVGQVNVADGTKAGKNIFVGRKGQADDAYLIMGHAFAFEIKAGRDTQNYGQIQFQAKWEAAGGTYVVVRKPTDAVDAIVQWAASTGRIF